jgi:glutamate carboxypeptidase
VFIRGSPVEESFGIGAVFTHTASDMSSLTRFCEDQLPATLDLLRQMVAINSFTENAAGVNRLGKLTAECFAELGFWPTFIPATNGAYGSHLVLKRPPIRSAPTIALISHLDTVYPEEEEQRNRFAWRVEGRRIYGPGTNDIKGGTVMIHLLLGALRAAAPAVFAETNWVVLLNSCEEVISADFGAVCRTHLPANALACLIFEADGGSGDDFSLVSARKGRATFSIEVEGRGAHAGTQHHRGANAVVQLAQLLPQLHALTDYAAGLTVNVGSIHGGTVMNRVPHFARAELEMRAFAPDVYARAKAAILALSGPGSVRSQEGDRHSCQIRVALGDETGPWPRNAATDKLIALWQESGRELGHRVGSEERGGLSDGNVIWNAFPTVDGLGPRGENSHCSEQSADGRKEQEWVDGGSLAPKTVLNAHAIIRLQAAAALSLLDSKSRAGASARAGRTPR